MSTEMGYKAEANSSTYTTQSDMNKMLKHLHELAKDNAGLAFMYVLYVIMPHSLDFQEGQLNREVRIQNDLTRIMNDLKGIQQDFNSAEGKSEDWIKTHTNSDGNTISQDIYLKWFDILKISNSSDFGQSSTFTEFGSQLYNNAGEFLQKYYVITGWKNVDGQHLPVGEETGDLSGDIYQAWHMAEKKPSYDNSDNNDTKYSGDNGAAVKAFQDCFDNLMTTSSGQQGSVQSEMKYYEQVYQSMEAVEQNGDKTVATLQRSANSGMKTTSA